MLNSEEHDQHRQNFLRYVTGGMSEEEAQRFEEQLISNHEFSDSAAACEQELIDSYAADELNDADRAALQAWIGTSPRRVQRVRVAEALRASANRTAKHRAFGRYVLPIAAVIAGLAVVTWVAGRHFSDKPGSVPETATVQSPPAGQSNAEKTNDLATPPDHVVLIIAERVRGEPLTQLQTPYRNSAVTLQVLLPDGAPEVYYRVRVMKAGGGAKVVDLRAVKPEVVANRLYLVVELGKGVLTRGTYEVSAVGTEDTFISRITVQ